MKRFFGVIAAVLAVSTAHAETWSVTATLADGSELKGTVSLTSFKLESSLGTLDVNMDQVVSVTVEGGRAVVKLRDGSSLAGKCAQVWHMVTSVGVVRVASDRLKTLSVSGKAAAEAPAGPGPGSPPPPNPPKAAGSTVPEPAAVLKPVASEFETVFAGPICPIRSGATLLAYDATNALLLTCDAATLKKGAAVNVSVAALPASGLADAPCWSLAPSGRRAWIACARKISVVDVEGMKELKAFSVEQDVIEIVAINDDAVLVRQPNGMAQITAAAQGVIRSWNRQGPLNPTSDRRRILSDSATYLVAEDGTIRRQGHYDGRNVGMLTFSGDGRWAASSHGHVYRVGAGSVAELAALGFLTANHCCVFLADSRAVLLFTRDRTLEVRRSGSWEPAGTHALGGYGHAAAVAPSGRAVWAVLSSTARPPSGRYSDSSRLAGPGRLFRLNLPE